MKRTFSLLAALAMVFGALAAPLALAQGDPSAQIDAYLTQLMKSESFSGQALVAKDGKVIFEKAYGMANREHDMPNTMDTRFATGDITTGVTAAAILMLQDQGKLNVNDPLCKYFDDCPKAWQAITLKRLLNSTAGMPNYLTDPKFKNEMDMRHTPNQLIDVFKKMPLTAEPDNKRYTYSPSSFVLLAKVIEKVSGMTFAQFVKNNILDKLGMTNTGIEDSSRVIKGLAEGYTGKDYKGQYADASNFYGFGSLYSTAGDLLKFQQAVTGGKLISPALTKEMLTPSTSLFSEEDSFIFGYAWELGALDGKDFQMLQNFAWIPGSGMVPRGYGGAVTHFPNQQVTLVMLSNSSHNSQALYQAAKPWLAGMK